LKSILVAVAWLAVILTAPTAQAQSHAPEPSGKAPAANASAAASPGDAMDKRLDENQTRLRTLRVATRSRSLDDAALKVQLAAIPPIQADLTDALSTLTPRLEDTQARLAELGAAPAAGQPPEAADIVSNRQRLMRSQQALDGNVRRARLMTVEAGQLTDTLTKRLQQNFSNRLWAQSRSVMDPALWGDFAASLPADLQNLGAAVNPQASPAQSQASSGAWLSALWLLLGVFLLAPARLLLDRLGRRWSTRVVPSSSLRKSALALWLVVFGALTPLLAGLALRQALSGVVAMTPVLTGLASALVSALVYAGVIEALGRSLLSPRRPSWRLAPIPDFVVDRLAFCPAVIALAVGLVSFAAQASDVIEASAGTSAAIDSLSVLLEVAAVGWSLALLGRARSVQAAAASAEEDETGAPSRLPWILAAAAAWMALAAALIAVIGGYLALATFIMSELIWIAMILAGLFLLMRFTDNLCQALFSPSSPLGRLFETTIGLSENALEQIGVLSSGLLRLGLLLSGWVAIVAPFGASAQEIFSRVTSTEMVFKLGQLSISPGLIFGGVVVLAIGLAITRVVRGWLELTYLPKTRLDVGVRASLTAALTYLGALIAVLMTCAYLGVSLDRIALLAGALSVGIGFGLQAVIGNFVSGLILLAERPVKVGDWIAIGDLEGDVRRINIRATEIEMADRSKLIVPNSDLISKTVRNVTHGGAMGRVKIVLRIASEADATQVRDLLLGPLSRHAEVIRDPAPGVYLTGVPDGALEFTALAHVATARHAFRIKSELLFAMVEALRAGGARLAGPPIAGEVQPPG
jgi:potassium efflux system protein